MEYVILLVVGLLLIVGGAFAFKQTKKYLELKTNSSSNYSNDQWWGFALWGGYIGAGILSLVGAILIIVSVISML